MEKFNTIKEIFEASINQIKEMADANTIVGKPIVTPNQNTIIPISKLTLGFVSGGGEYNTQKKAKQLPNVGGASAAVSALPIGFIVESGNSISFISSKESSSLDAFMTIASVALDKLDLFFNLNNNNKIQQTNKIKEEKSQNNKTKKVKKEV